MRVSLSEHEMRWAAHVGIERRLEAHKLSRPAVYGEPGSVWDADIEGAAGELVLCKALGVYHVSAFRFADTDVGKRYQVRTTRRTDGCLLLHKRDSDEHVFVLVVGGCGIYTIAGCIQGKAAKRDEYWQDRSGAGRPCYFVPQSALAPFEGAMQWA